MKKLIPFVACIALTMIISAQELQHESVAVNIEVPVRVYKGDAFINKEK